MNKQDAPAHRGQLRAARALLKDIRATAETGRPKCARAVRYRYTPNPFSSFSCLPSSPRLAFKRLVSPAGAFPPCAAATLIASAA
jgi:hypothetical protein